jgi:hypothetical protein
MDPSRWEAAEWGAFGQVGALVAAVVAGVLVWLQVRQGRQVREDQTRPYVIVDFEFRGLLVMLTVSNIGTTPATDIRIEFDRPLESPTRGMDANRFAVFSEAIPMLAPGRKINLTFGNGPDFFPGAGEGVPLRYVANVKYCALEHRRSSWRKPKTYADPPLVLDLQPFKHAAVDRDDLHDIASKIRLIEQTVSKWTSRGRLNVNTIAQAEINADEQAFWEEHQAEAASRQSNGTPREQLQSKLRAWASKAARALRGLGRGGGSCRRKRGEQRRYTSEHPSDDLRQLHESSSFTRRLSTFTK